MKITTLLLQILLAATAVLAQNTTPADPVWFGGNHERGLPGGTNNPPPPAVPFLKFAPRVKVTWDDQYLYIQNNGLPDHCMIVGITAWQQQVPLPGAKITGFTNSPDDKHFSLRYTVNDQPASVNYENAGNGAWNFQYVNADGTKRTETYRAGGRNNQPPRNNPPPENLHGPRPDNARGGMVAPVLINAKRSGNFILRSIVVTNDGVLPVEFTGDGASASPPLEWSGAPAGTKSFAVVMDHFPGPGDVKWYWTLYNIPANVHSLPKNARGIGVAGNNSVNRDTGYAPPHSKGPGAKTYFITVYALSAPVEISSPPASVNRNILLTAIKDRVLDSAQLKFTYDRTRFIQQNGNERPPRRDKGDRPNP